MKMAPAIGLMTLVTACISRFTLTTFLSTKTVRVTPMHMMQFLVR